MGNQNTSGIVEKEAKNEAPDNAQGVSPPDSETVEKQIVVQENAAEAEGDKIHPVEIQECDDKDIEDHKGSFEACDAVMDISTNGSDLGEGRSKLNDEEQDQPCTLTDIQEEENVMMDEDSEADDHDAKKNEKDSDAASLEGTFSEACAHEEELGRDDEQSDSFNTVTEAPRASLLDLDSSTSQHEQENDCSALDHEEKPMNQEIDHFLIRCRSNPAEVIKSEFEENGDHLLEDAEKQQDNEPTDHNVLVKAIHLESDASATENVHETESEATEKCVIELQSSTKLDTQCLSSKTPPTSDETEPNPSCIGAAQVELRKSPSFDFGISFDTRSQESDQTPLLYQDKTARRSLSSCSNIRFPNTGVQTEYVGKPLQFQAVQVEEKTIRMERSNSESAQNTLNNKQENANAVTEDAHTNDSNASPSRDADAISPKGNGRRKARSSLFTTCICCTAAIS